MADITTPENRAFRYGMLQVAISLAAPLSPIVGSYIYSKWVEVSLAIQLITYMSENFFEINNEL